VSTISNSLRLDKNTYAKREVRAAQQTNSSVAKSEQSKDSLSVSGREKSATQPESKVRRNAAIGAGVALAVVGADILLSNASRNPVSLIGRAFLTTPGGLAIIAGIGAVGAAVGGFGTMIVDKLRGVSGDR
jgi:hypothetical protein